MKTSNAMQIKVLINNRAKAAGVSLQLMLQNCMLEAANRPRAFSLVGFVAGCQFKPSTTLSEMGVE